MIEVKQNIFDPFFMSTCDVICFTSNGIVNSSDSLIMGAGVAKEFADKYTWLPKTIGKLVKTFGNVPNCVKIDPVLNTSLRPIICSFPTKNHYRDASDLNLIQKSANILKRMADANKWNRVALPFPGIGFGKLPIESVREIIQTILDDRFLVLTK